LLVELGYNFQLKKDLTKAKKYYEEALDRIRNNPQEVYGVAPAFERRSQIEYALQAYQTAVQLEPKFNFNFQMALLYGQLGNTDMMVSMLLDEAHRNPHSSIIVQNQLSRFMNGEEGETTFNESLRKALLVRAQKNQDVFWNEYLSWFYVQQKEYGKAFIQEKAIYRREPETLSNIENLAQLANEEGETETAKEIFTFLLENSQDIDLQIKANYYLMDMRIAAASEKSIKPLKQI